MKTKKTGIPVLFAFFMNQRTLRFMNLVYLVFLFRFFDVDDFAAFVVATARANCVREAHFTAVRTLGQILRGEEIIRAAAITPGTGNSSFRKWCHL